MHRKLVLDTCGLLWLAAGGGNLSAVALEAVDDADLVMVSAISAWEIGLKAAKGQLELSMHPREWFCRALKVHDHVLADLSVEILTHANDLTWHHRDPADRFIIATAVIEQCPIVTADRRFGQYGVTTLQ